jgi:predicted nucleic acid-binding Zn ribbon protein
MDLILDKNEKELKNTNLWLANIFVLVVAVVLVFYAVAKFYSLF